MITREQLESIYEELLGQAKQYPIGSVESERVDAKLCLIEDMLDKVELQ